MAYFFVYFLPISWKGSSWRCSSDAQFFNSCPRATKGLLWDKVLFHSWPKRDPPLSDSVSQSLILELELEPGKMGLHRGTASLWGSTQDPRSQGNSIPSKPDLVGAGDLGNVWE